MALQPLAGLLAQHTTLKLMSGVAFAAGQLDWDGKGAGQNKTPGLRYAGNAGLDDFRLDPEGAANGWYR